MDSVLQYILTAPAHVNAKIKLPASKSISNRSLIIYALSGRKTLPENLSDCDDTQVLITALRDLPETINIHAAGTAMRFLTAYLSVTPGKHILTGTDRMKQRPIGILVDSLRYLGADITYTEKEGYPPLCIQGHQLEGGALEIPGNLSSQFISALLLIGPVLKNGLILKLTGTIISRPYIDLTLCTMREFGAQADWTDIDTITVAGKPYQDRPFSIENDWSSASYWYEAMALSKNSQSMVQLEGLTDGSKQGDSVVKYIFNLLGIKTSFASTQPGKATTVTLRRHPCLLSRLEYDFKGSPDLAQTLVTCCCGLKIPFKFTGLSNLRIKETDRIAALETELRKLGFIIKDENGDTLYWDGEHCEASLAPIDTYEDHRMALSFAPLASIFPHLRINHPEVVSKSYPNYWNDLRTAGYRVEESGE
ncbi:MAG: 3-phosphoshikimate 1-carboxyvinyltransferase [Prevotella sp.]|jgi:3-phosphoshikimate 1-carboxyvinyltransferase|nr:3-phosphoshikimate 1-carboxyvinyltransferase [Prevotella sp.]MCH3994479.1 3-phosphoshikimate 1-carboxyvinyltransferase [Prevotella sp.]